MQCFSLLSKRSTIIFTFIIRIKVNSHVPTLKSLNIINFLISKNQKNNEYGTYFLFLSISYLF